jgi:hypothetical protein
VVWTTARPEIMAAACREQKKAAPEDAAKERLFRYAKATVPTRSRRQGGATGRTVAKFADRQTGKNNEAVRPHALCAPEDEAHLGSFRNALASDLLHVFANVKNISQN